MTESGLTCSTEDFRSFLGDAGCFSCGMRTLSERVNS